jgi:GMP synthase-like glutamine amidotransferase
MKPVAILRYHRNEGPGYFGAYLDRKGVPRTLIRVDEREKVPGDPQAFSGIVCMGGPMSVNDNLPWIDDVLGLVRSAVAAEVPVLGHCLGSQLMARALGGTVSPNPVVEIGWGSVTIAESDPARHWFGGLHGFESFHWHGETFTLPPQAARLASSAHCANQAFALGPHLALQCHVEMTADMIRTWCRSNASELAAMRSSPGVQSAAEMEERIDARLVALHEVADRLYDRWTEHLAV